MLRFHMGSQLSSTGASCGTEGTGDAQVHVSPLNMFCHIFPKFLAVAAQGTDVKCLPCSVLVHPNLGVHALLQLLTKTI